MAPTRKLRGNSPSTTETITTPQRSPIKKTIVITQRQKQALIDNLQLEITERARRLRAQYALQAQSLRSKLERRVSRVPATMRSKTMEELLLKSIAKTDITNKTAQVQVAKKTAIRKDQIIPDKPTNFGSPKSRGVKRKSGAMYDVDKENTPDPSAPIPKRQARDAATMRTNPTMVLSPKTNNSKTIAQSPSRLPFGAATLAMSRPDSPLKSASSPFKLAAAAATAGLANMVGGKSIVAMAARSRTNSKTVKTTAKATKATQPRTVSAASNASGSSGTSTGTIVRRVGAAIKDTIATKKAPTTTRAATQRKGATTRTKAEPVKAEPTTTAKRTLRKRA